MHIAPPYPVQASQSHIPAASRQQAVRPVTSTGSYTGIAPVRAAGSPVIQRPVAVGEGHGTWIRATGPAVNGYTRQPLHPGYGAGAPAVASVPFAPAPLMLAAPRMPPNGVQIGPTPAKLMPRAVMPPGSAYAVQAVQAPVVQAPIPAARTPQIAAEVEQQPLGRLPKKVLFIRHGTSQGNVSVKDIPDPLLTPLGEREAKSWEKEMPKYDAEIVLVSPLRRTVQTACLAFSMDTAPMLLCRCARELGFEALENSILSTQEEFKEFLGALPRGDCVRGAETELREAASDESDEASLARLLEVIAARPEAIVAVVCHWHVILDLTGVDTDNAELVECEMGQNQQLKVLSRRQPPHNEPSCQYSCQ